MPSSIPSNEDQPLSASTVQAIQRMCNSIYLSPYHSINNDLNDYALDLLPGPSHMCISFTRYAADARFFTCSVQDNELNLAHYSGLPPGALLLKRGGIYRMLADHGPLHRGETVVVMDCRRSTSVVWVCKATDTQGHLYANWYPIVKVPQSSHEIIHGHAQKVIRVQFPITPTYAATVDASQSRTFSGNVYIDLVLPLFSHGQLFVAASRSTSPTSTTWVVRNRQKTIQNVFSTIVSNWIQTGVLHRFIKKTTPKPKTPNSQLDATTPSTQTVLKKPRELKKAKTEFNIKLCYERAKNNYSDFTEKLCEVNFYDNAIKKSRKRRFKSEFHKAISESDSNEGSENNNKKHKRKKKNSS